METEFYCLRVNILKSVKDRLEKEIELDSTHTKTLTIIVRKALDLYLRQKDMERTTNTVNLDSIHIPITGLTLPDQKKEEIIPDPEIQGERLNSKHLPLPIDPSEIRRAKRNKIAGRIYNHDLEQYFDQI